LKAKIVLIEDGGETVLKPGECAGFKAGVANGHHLVQSPCDAVLLEIARRGHMSAGNAGLEARALARLEHRLAAVLDQHDLAFKHVDELVFVSHASAAAPRPRPA